MTETIHLARDFHLPLDAVTQTFGIVGRKRSGKSHTACVLVEGMLSAGAQVVVLDPVGNFWGLRLGRDGKAKGYDVLVLGGMHGDLPLEPGAGKLVADLLVDRALSAVLDVSTYSWAKRKELVAGFIEAFYHRMQEQRRAVHVVLEEAQVFAPQKPQQGEQPMLGRINEMVRIGGNYGIGATLVSQRPASVSKEVLSQVEALVVHQVTSPHDREAVEGWVVETGEDAEDWVAELPALEQGRAFFWSPQWLRRFERIAVLQKRTLDTSATPRVGGRRKVEPRPLAREDLEELRGAMREVVERAEQDDPKALRKQIRELEGRLAKAKGQASPEALERARREGARESERRAAEVVARAEAWVRRVARAAEAVETEHKREGDAIEAVATAHKRAGDSIEGLEAAVRETLDLEPWEAAPAPRAERAARPRHEPRPAAAAPRHAARVPAAEGRLPRGERAVLTAIAQHPDGVTREQLTVLTGYKRSSRDAYIQRLGERGLVSREGRTVLATEEGVAALGPDFEPLPTGEALVEHWRERLPAGERALFEVLIAAYPEAVEREVLSASTGYRRSSRDAYVQRLRARQLVEVERGRVRAAPVLFLEGR